MKKVLTILALLFSVAAFSQSKWGVEVGVGRGAYSDTYKQIGLNYDVNKTYVLKASYGVDRIEESKANRSVLSAGTGLYLNKNVETFVEGSAAFNRFNGSHHDTKFGATFGANYHFGNKVSLGLSYNTIPVANTPNQLGRKPFPVATLGLHL